MAPATRGVRPADTKSPPVCDDRSMSRRRLLIVDDHEDFRMSARTLLELEGFDVVGAVEDGAAALSAAQRLRPDLVLLDIQLSGADGFEIARVHRARLDDVCIVLISSRDRSEYTAQLRDAPVAGFVGKSELSGAALRALVA